jgi:hypothetical protein
MIEDGSCDHQTVAPLQVRGDERGRAHHAHHLAVVIRAPGHFTCLFICLYTTGLFDVASSHGAVPLNVGSGGDGRGVRIHELQRGRQRVEADGGASAVSLAQHQLRMLLDDVLPCDAAHHRRLRLSGDEQVPQAHRTEQTVRARQRYVLVHGEDVALHERAQIHALLQHFLRYADLV